jgi:hypothetical protein
MTAKILRPAAHRWPSPIPLSLRTFHHSYIAAAETLPQTPFCHFFDLSKIDSATFLSLPAMTSIRAGPPTVGSH